MVSRRKKPAPRSSTAMIRFYLKDLKTSSYQTQKQLDEIQIDLKEMKERVAEQVQEKEESKERKRRRKKKKETKESESTSFDLAQILDLLGNPMIQSLMNGGTKRKR
jgi:hypothetical protein